MQVINVKQGTDEWLAERLKHLTASEAPIMMGASKVMSRDDLLTYKTTKQQQVVSSFTQRIFDKGHEAEANARPILERQLGEELYPVVGCEEIDGLPLWVSLDGMTMSEEIIFEHKQLNKELFETVSNRGELPPFIYWQLEQQLLVSKASKAIFVVSDGTENNWAQCEYTPVKGRVNKLIKGWKQFLQDLDGYEPPVYEEKPEAEPVKDLPAINYDIDKSNGISLTSNLGVFKEAASKLVKKSKQPIETDQDFANAEQMVKIFAATEKNIDVLCDQALGEVKDIETFVKDLREIKENIRQARLHSDKQVKTRKEEIRKEIKQKAESSLQEVIAEAFDGIDGVNVPSVSADFDGAMRGKKTVKSLNEAVNDELAKASIEAKEMAELIKRNLSVIEENAEYKFLFNDINSLVLKSHDDFSSTVKIRILEYKEEQREKEEAERKRIQAEEREKAEREAQQRQERINHIVQRIQRLKAIPEQAANYTAEQLGRLLNSLQNNKPQESDFDDQYAMAMSEWENVISKVSEMHQREQEVEQAYNEQSVTTGVDMANEKDKTVVSRVMRKQPKVEYVTLTCQVPADCLEAAKQMLEVKFSAKF